MVCSYCQLSIPSLYGLSASFPWEWLRAVPRIVVSLGAVNASDRFSVTVIGALGARGLPLVVAPIREAQPVIAPQGVDAGAGVRMRFNRIRPRDVAEAGHEVLSRPCYREAAHPPRASFETAGGASAPTALEALAC
jgi:hypothetical protein